MLVIQAALGSAAAAIIAGKSNLPIPFIRISDLDKVDGSWPFVTEYGFVDFNFDDKVHAAALAEIAKTHPHAVVITSLDINCPTNLSRELHRRGIKSVAVYPPFLSTYEQFQNSVLADLALLPDQKDVPVPTEEAFHAYVENMPSIADAPHGSAFVVSDGREDAARDVIGFFTAYPKVFELIDASAPIDPETTRRPTFEPLPIADLFQLGWRLARTEQRDKYSSIPKPDLIGASPELAKDWKDPDLGSETFESYCARVQKFNDALNFIGDWDKSATNAWEKGQLFLIPPFPVNGSLVGPWCMEVTRDVSFDELKQLVDKLNEVPCAAPETRNEQYHAIRVAMAARDAGIMVQRAVETIAMGRGLIPPKDTDAARTQQNAAAENTTQS